MADPYRFRTLPRGLWPTFRWLAGYLKARGVTQRVFFERAGIPWSTVKKAAARPDRPLPYTPQWRNAIKRRQSLIKKQGRQTTATLAKASEIDRHRLESAAENAGASKFTVKEWLYADRLPDTKLGRAVYLQACQSSDPGRV